MARLKDMFEQQEVWRLSHEHEEQEAEASKVAVTVRLDGILVCGLDRMAEHHGWSRQQLLSTIIEKGFAEVVEGTFTPYENKEQLVKDFWDANVKSAKKAGYL